MTDHSKIYQNDEKTEDRVDHDEITTSIVARDLLTKATRKRRQQHQGTVPGSPQHTKVAQSSCSVQISEEEKGREELSHDEAWYLEQAIVHLFPPSVLSSTDTTHSNRVITSSIASEYVEDNSSVCSAPSSSSSSMGFSVGLDVGACFVVHARLASWYHQRGTTCRNIDTNDSGEMKNDADRWYVNLLAKHLSLLLLSFHLISTHTHTLTYTLFVLVLIRYEKAHSCALIAVEMYHRVFVTNNSDYDELLFTGVETR